MPPSLTKINDEFLRDLEEVSDQVSSLLREVRNSEVDFAGIKTELRVICDSVKELSTIIRGGEKGISLLTRVALLEQQLEQLEKHDDNKRQQQNSLVGIEVAEKAGKWQMRVAIATGILALLASVGTTLIQIFK